MPTSRARPAAAAVALGRPEEIRATWSTSFTPPVARFSRRPSRGSSGEAPTRLDCRSGRLHDARPRGGHDDLCDLLRVGDHDDVGGTFDLRDVRAHPLVTEPVD